MPWVLQFGLWTLVHTETLAGTSIYHILRWVNQSVKQNVSLNVPEVRYINPDCCSNFEWNHHFLCMRFHSLSPQCFSQQWNWSFESRSLQHTSLSGNQFLLRSFWKIILLFTNIYNSSVVYLVTAWISRYRDMYTTDNLVNVSKFIPRFRICLSRYLGCQQSVIFSPVVHWDHN